ncbi:MAG: hypothetical protein JG768_1624 [Fusobacteriales bacterium]|jgi:uncharacterized protein with HEPN domain|nr:hypothetical protein [Fusobacteriales bacterium]
MSRKWKLRVKDALKSIEYIQIDTKEMDFEDFENNRLVRQAVERNLEIIGEALNKIPQNIKEKYKEISWREIVAVRNFVVHEYFDVSQDIEWDIIQNDLDELKIRLLEILEKEEEI